MCNCIADINKSLLEMNSNTELDIPFKILYDGMPPYVDKVIIKTRKRDDKNRKKPITLMGSHCPFCGEKYAVSEA
jgi:hypothetical protein